MSPERKLEAYLVKRCKERGLLTRKVQWIGQNGAPDRVIFGYGGELMWVELKSLHGKLSVVQEREIQRLTARGQNVWIARTNLDLELLFDRLSPPRLSDPDHPSDP